MRCSISGASWGWERGGYESDGKSIGRIRGGDPPIDFQGGDGATVKLAKDKLLRISPKNDGGSRTHTTMIAKSRVNVHPMRRNEQIDWHGSQRLKKRRQEKEQKSQNRAGRHENMRPSFGGGEREWIAEKAEPILSRGAVGGGDRISEKE